MSAPIHIAVVDDEPDVTDLICGYVAGQGFRATALHRGADLLALMPVDPPALVLLDVGLPGEDGFAIARRLREHWRAGLIIVSGRGESIDKVVGLEVGADDYITKPFDLRELVARVKAVLRRIEERGAALSPAMTPATTPAAAAAAREPDILRFEGWALELGPRRLVHPDGREVALTSGEFDLLRVLAQHPGRVLSRDFLLEQTRGREAAPFDRTIDVQIGRLRKKMDDDADSPRLIKSVRGAGYLFAPRVAAA